MLPAVATVIKAGYMFGRNQYFLSLNYSVSTILKILYAERKKFNKKLTRINKVNKKISIQTIDN